MKQSSVPVLYYHRIGAPDPSYLSISCEDFERQLIYLKRAGYKMISVAELLERINHRVCDNRKVVCLTFDDGFVDNLLYAHPLLQKHGGKAALFVATSLIRPESQARAQEMTDFNNAHTLARRGDLRHFLCASELRQMSESGVWEIMSHSHLHNQVFTSAKITGYYPDNDNHWGILSAYRLPLEHGRWPVFARGASLVNPAWWPQLPQGCAGSDVKPSDITFRQEDENEFARRVEEDLRLSLQIIKKISPAAPPVICWPWGKVTPRLEKIAAEVGYVAALRTDTGANSYGMNPMQIHRFAVKKPDMARFKLGLFLRNHRFLAKLYSLVRK